VNSSKFIVIDRLPHRLFWTCIKTVKINPAAVELIARKKVNVKELITHRFRLDEFEKALQTLDNPAEKALKVVITN